MYKRIVISLSIAVSSLASACAAGGTEPPPAVEVDSENLLAAVELEDGRMLRFYDQDIGFTMLETLFDDDPRWVVTDEMRGLSLLEIYQRVTPAGTVVPERVLEAHKRYLAAAENPAETAAPPAVTGAGEQSPALYSFEEFEWFRANHCTSPENVECTHQTPHGSTQWHQDAWFAVTGHIHAGGQPAILQLLWWDGSREVTISQVALGGATLARLSASYHVRTYFRGAIGFVGDGQEVSLAADAATFKPGPRR